jgi:hypothetical protein
MEKDPFNEPFFTDHDNWMKNRIRQTRINIAIGSLIVIGIIIALGIKSNNEEVKIKSYLGQKVLIQKDTSLIVDYSSWEKNYILNNGDKVSFDLIDKVVLK